VARALGRAATALQRASDRAAARTAWGEAFDDWLLMGAAYGALGDLDSQVTAALATLERDPLDRRAAASLAAGAHKLPAAVRTAELAPVDYAIRAHEILEDVERDRMVDSTGVRATADGVAATRVVIGTLHDVLAGRGDALQTVDTRLTQLEGTLREIRREHGAWPAPDALPRAEHQRLLGQLGAALEALAGVPGALETSLPPKLPVLR
jgi:high-affinity iron transporter